jgi:hypothetical protein
MAKATPTPHIEIPFAADWEWCNAKVTYKPSWKNLGSTPKPLKLAPDRAYRVSVRPETTVADLSAIFQAVPSCNIRTVRVPSRSPVSAACLGDALAGLEALETIGMAWSSHLTAWLVSISQAGGTRFQLELEGWPVDEVAASLRRIPRAAGLTVRMDDYKDGFSLSPLFGIRGLVRVDVEHASRSRQELDWTGLSGQTGLRTLSVRGGFLDKVFWAELGKLKQLREFELHWPEKAKASPGSLARLTSLKKLDGSCLFDSTPEAFRALGECPALEDVRLDQCRIDDTSAAGVGSIAAAKACYIWNVELSDAGMKALCRWPAIKSLTLAENSRNPTPITEVGFAALGDLETLEMLHLQGFDKVNSAGWAALQRLPCLRRLMLASDPPFDLMEATGPLPTVERLVLAHCNGVGPGGLRQLRAMPRLRSLALHAHRSTPYNVPLDEVSGLRQLRALFLGALHTMTDDQLGRLAGLGGLEQLFLDETDKITDRGIAGLAGLKKLQVVSLYKLAKLTDRTVTTVAALPRLETLFLRCTGKITDQGLAGLAAARNLKTLHLDYARNLTGEGLLRLARELPLEELAVDSSPHLTDAHLMQLLKHPTLKRVRIGQCKNTTAAGREAMAVGRPDWGAVEFHPWQPLGMTE